MWGHISSLLFDGYLTFWLSAYTESLTAWKEFNLSLKDDSIYQWFWFLSNALLIIHFNLFKNKTDNTKQKHDNTDNFSFL